MKFNKYEWRLLVKVLLLFAVLITAAWLLVNKNYLTSVIAIPIILFQMVDIFRLLKKAQDEVQLNS